jgi:cysteine synthase A
MSSPRDRMLADVLRAMPLEWLGTTFKNKELLGRERWSAQLEALLSMHVAEGSVVTSRELEDLGNAEDYLRVASNVSTLLEHEMARKFSLPICQVPPPPSSPPPPPRSHL